MPTHDCLSTRREAAVCIQLTHEPVKAISGHLVMKCSAIEKSKDVLSVRLNKQPHKVETSGLKGQQSQED